MAKIVRQQWGILPSPVIVHHSWYLGARSAERPRDRATAQAALRPSLRGVVDGGLLAGENPWQIQWGRCDLLSRPGQHKGRSCLVLTFEYFDPFYDGWDPIDEEDEHGGDYEF
jgi:hypothetical protein